MIQKNDTSLDLDRNSVSIKSSTIVKLNEHFTIFTMEGPVDFTTEIVCDFADVPEKYHEVCLNILTSKYTNKVSFGNNPFSECKPVVKRKWWEFWKPKYIETKK